MKLINQGKLEGLQKGIQKGIKKGIKKGVEKVAYSLLKQGINDSIILKATGLTQKQLDYLKTIKNYNDELIDA